MKRKLTLLFFFGIFCLGFAFGQGGPVVIGAGQFSDVVITSSSESNNTSAQNTVADNGFLPNPIATSRFLGQATLGADYDLIQAVSNIGEAQWLDEQLTTTSALSIEQYVKNLTQLAADSILTNGGDVTKIEPLLRYWHFGWWQYVMDSPDLVRSRVALALSEIFVISELPQLAEVPLSLANYYDMLTNNAFGNFRDLLEAVTFHPAMGVYLTHMNNPKADPSINRFPDENYAREIMQLFSIGLYELNPDGSRKLDGSGNLIPTYDNDDIEEFAKIFTGMTWGDNFLFGRNPTREESYTQPMQMFNFWHEPGPKTLLNGVVVPDRDPVDGLADVQAALDNLFNHPNVGPFIGRLLIQRLVKSNPSPAYIARVTAAFNDNGQGVRGDMKAFIRAILLDPEARNCPDENDAFGGMLREPMVRYTHAAKAFKAASVEGTYRNKMDDFYNLTFQRPLGSPSVFNFFQSAYQPIGSIEENGLVAPEFQITNSISIMGYGNELHDWVMEDYDMMEYGKIFDGEQKIDDKKVNLDLSYEIMLGEEGRIDELLNRLDLLLTHGQMTDLTRSVIKNAIEKIPEYHSDLRGRMAIFLTMISPDYLILR
ncbi:MAG: DUF1800 domain-containing protein [Bacteroidota bacterium]